MKVSSNIEPQESPVHWLSDCQYERLPIAHRALAWADSQVGIKESGRNRGKQVSLYQEVAGLGGGGYPWCACFVYWCLIQAGCRAVSLPNRGRAAAVWRWRQWAQWENRLKSKPQRGDLFFWLDSDYQGHIGFCLSKPILGIIRTIEGNTSTAGSREGDGVHKRYRSLASLKRKYKHGFISLNHLES